MGLSFYKSLYEFVRWVFRCICVQKGQGIFLFCSPPDCLEIGLFTDLKKCTILDVLVEVWSFVIYCNVKCGPPRPGFPRDWKSLHTLWPQVIYGWQIKILIANNWAKKTQVGLRVRGGPQEKKYKKKEKKPITTTNNNKKPNKKNKPPWVRCQENVAPEGWSIRVQYSPDKT